jgi:hypothetical protein
MTVMTGLGKLRMFWGNYASAFVVPAFDVPIPLRFVKFEELSCKLHTAELDYFIQSRCHCHCRIFQTHVCLHVEKDDADGFAVIFYD